MNYFHQTTFIRQFTYKKRYPYVSFFCIVQITSEYTDKKAFTSVLHADLVLTMEINECEGHSSSALLLCQVT